MWIIASDQLNAALMPPELREAMQTYKGWAFVLVTGALLYFLLRRELLARAHAEILRHRDALRFLDILDKATDAIITLDQRQHICQFNKGAERLFDYQAAVLIGQPINVLLPDLRVDAAPNPESPKSGEYYEIPARRRDGALFVAEVSIAQISPEAKANDVFVIILRDVSEHKQTEATLRQRRDELEARITERTSQLSEANTLLREQIDERERVDRQLEATTSRLTALIENLQAGVLFLDASRNVSLVNQHFCTMFNLGGAPQTLAGMAVASIIEQISPLCVEPDAFTRRINRLLEDQTLFPEEEVAITDGRLLEQDFVPVIQNGLPLGYLFQYRDMTDRRYSEEALQQALQQVNTLYAVGRALITADTLEQLLQAFAEPILQGGSCQVTLAYFETNETGHPEWAEVVARVGSAAPPTGRRYYMPDDPIGSLLLSSPYQMLIIPDVNEYKLITDKLREGFRAGGVRALVAIPLVAHGRWIGCVSFTWNEPHTLDEHDHQLYSFLIPEMAALVEGRRLFERVVEAERRYRLIADNVTDVISQNTPEGVITYVSPSCRTLLDYAPEEMIGHSIYEFVYPEDVEATRASLSAIPASLTTLIFSYRMRLKEGHYTWFETTGRILRMAESPEVIIMVSRDITERKKAEDALQKVQEVLEQRVEERTAELSQANALLVREVAVRLDAERAMRESEAKLRLIVNQLPALVWTTDVDLRITSVLGSGSAQWGVEGEASVGKILYEYFPGGVISPAIQAHQTALRGTPSNYELNLRGMDFDVRVEVLRDAANQIVGCISIAQNISARKQAEAEIQRLNAELERRVVERTAQLEAANKELEAFSYSVSHDLRAPLRAMDGFSRIVSEEYAAHLPEEARRYLGLVRTNALQMSQLIDDLLAFSHLSRQSLKKQRVEPAAIVQEALRSLENEYQGRQVEIVIGDLPPCQADPSLLRQVYLNLLSNAIKFTRRREAARIEIGCQAQNREYIYFVRDNGVGFDMRYAGKLFGVFQRLHRAEDYEGTGVGLAVIQRIINRHGGRIWAEAEPDKGAVFYFTFEGRTDEH